MGDVVAAHCSRIGSVTVDRDEEKSPWAKEDRLCKSTWLADFIEIDLIETLLRYTVEDQDLVRVAPGPRGKP